MSEWVTFTGTRSDDERFRRVVEYAVSRLAPGMTVVTGGCLGVDAAVARAAKARGLRVHTVVPANRKLVDPDWRRYCDTYELMPEGTSYAARDARMVARSTGRIVAIPRFPEVHPGSRRSGTWLTVRLARRAGRTVEIVDPDEVTAKLTIE